MTAPTPPETPPGNRKDPFVNLVQHAATELALAGEDPEIVDATLHIVGAFASVGHSGASAHHHREMIHRLLAFENLSPLTDDPAEWFHHTAEAWGRPGGIWQNARNSEAFSTDGGKTYYLLSEQKRRRWPFKGWTRPLHASAAARAQ